MHHHSPTLSIALLKSPSNITSKMTKLVVCIIVSLVSLAANAMAVDESVLMCRAVRIANGESKHKQCLDFNPPLLKGSNPNHEDDDVPAELVPCTNERLNQLWILSPEGYIRSLGNLCLIFEPFVNPRVSPRNFVTVKDCEKSSEEAKKWKVWPDGIITHVVSHQVLTASFCHPTSLCQLRAKHICSISELANLSLNKCMFGMTFLSV